MADLLTRRAALRRAAPLMVANLSTPVVGLVDTAVIGRTGSAEELAAVALGALIFSILYWLLGFLRMGTTGLTAQAAGAGDEAAVWALLLRGVALAAGFGLLFVALQWPIRELAFGALSGSADVEAVGRAYFDARIWGAPAALMGFVAYGWLIALGRTRQALYLQLSLNIFNVGLDLYFVYGLDLGAPGVAAAAAWAQWLNLILVAWWVARTARSRGAPRVAAADVLTAKALRAVLVVNVDIFLRTASLLLGIAWFNEVSLRQGTVVLAANAILLQIITATSYFLDAFAHITEAEAGRAMGARSVKMLRQSLARTSEWAFIFGLLCGLLIWFGGPLAVHGLTTDPETRRIATEYLGYCALVPLIGWPSWQMDGVMLGATRGPLMRNAMAVALLGYLAMDAVLRPRFGIEGIWAAFLGYYVLRFVTLAVGYPSLERELRRP